MKIQPKTSHRGIALATVMVMVGVLVMLSTAFFEVYRTHYALARSTITTQSASAACEAVYEYVAFRLEHDRSWGAVPFPDEGDSRLLGPEFTVTTTAGSHIFSGRIESLDAEFTATLYNNLNGGGSPEVANKARSGHAFCVVTAVCRDATRRAEFVLDVAPLFDSSVLTRADLRVGAQSLTIRSTDPDRNMLRAEGDILVPDLLDGQNTRFLTEDNRPDDRGLLWTKKKVFSDGGGSPEEVDTDEELAKARQNSHGKVVPNGESHFSIFDINESQLQLPEDATVVSLAADPLASKGGRWTFVRREAEVDFTATYVKDGLFTDKEKEGGGTKTMWVDVLEFYKDPDDPTPTAVYRGAERTEDIIASIPDEIDGFINDYELDKDSIEVSALKIPAYEGLGVITEVVPGDAKTYGAHGEIRFDLTKQEVTIKSEATVEVDGPFYVTSLTDPNAPSDTPPPVLDLGYEADSGALGGVAKASLVARGTISIENGVTQGLGRLVSRQGDVRIQPKNTDSVTVDASHDGSGLLVYAGRNVILNNPDQTRDWNFRGLVYARQGIKMDGGGAGNARFEGTIVSLQEHAALGPDDPNGIEFVDCTDVEFIYNPDLLSGYVRELPEQRIQVQSVYWKR